MNLGGGSVLMSFSFSLALCATRNWVYLLRGMRTFKKSSSGISVGSLGFFLGEAPFLGDKNCIHFGSPVAAEQSLDQALVRDPRVFTVPAVVNDKL